MRILVVNPNTTASMTELIGKCARASVGPGVVVDAVDPGVVPVSLESQLVRLGLSTSKHGGYATPPAKERRRR